MNQPRTPLRRTCSFDSRHDGSNSGGNSGPRPGFLSFRARQFQSLTPSSIDGVTPTQRALPLWSPLPTPQQDGTKLKTPVLQPSQTPGSNNSSCSISINDSFISNDTPPQSTKSVRGAANGGILVGKIRELQRQLTESEKEKENMRTQLQLLQQLQKEKNSRSKHNSPSNQRNYDNHGNQHMEQRMTTTTVAVHQDNHVVDERDSRRLSTNTLREEDCSVSSDQSADETMIQGAMSQIQSGVNQLEGALRRLSRSGSLGGSTRSFQKHFDDLSRSTKSTTTAATTTATTTINAAAHTAGGGNSAAAEATSSTWLQGDVVCGHGTPSWWSELQCGDMVDGRDKDREWYVACIESIETCNISDDDTRGSGDEKNPEEMFRVLISFEGWSSEWDIWLHSERDIAELAPRGTHVRLTCEEKEEDDKCRRQQQRQQQRQQLLQEEEEEKMVEDDHNMSLAPENEDDGNVSRGSTQIGGTPEQQRTSTKSWDHDLSPVEYVQSLGGSSRMDGSPLKHERWDLHEKEARVLRRQHGGVSELDLSPNLYIR